MQGHPTQPILLRVYLSSPHDVAEERNLARRVLKDELPVDPFIRNRVTLDVVSWDDPTAYIPVAATLTPQEAVNRGLLRPSECDIVIVILWSRMGTPLPSDYRKPNGEPYISGVEWKYEQAYSASPAPDILVYHRTEVPMVPLDDPELGKKQDQFSLVKKFLARFNNPDGSSEGVITSYEGPTDFAERFKNDMRHLIRDRIKSIEELRRSGSARHRTAPGEANARRGVFISYSHMDKDWLARLQVHLAPLERDYTIKYWDDTKIQPGSDQREEIEGAMSKARVAVLLISANFLASEFIRSEELPRLLATADEEGAIIMPLIVSPSRFSKTVTLSRFQAVNSPTQPLIGMAKAESEAVLVKVADAIEDALKA